MRLDRNLAVLGTLWLPGAAAWGSLGHITVAYIATDLVNDRTSAYFQDLLRNSTEHYLAGVATWADSIRYTKWGRFSKDFHFIDAKDDPPAYCGVDFARDCKAEGCIVSAIQNYTTQLLLVPPPGADANAETAAEAGSVLPAWRRAQAAKFVVHFVGDIHQPLHVENVAQGGNGIHVRWESTELNLHHVWDSSIAEKLLGGVGRRPYEAARRWADDLTEQIREGRYAAPSRLWTNGISLDDPVAAAMSWANESNALVCTHVFPEGPTAIAGQELSGDYYEKAAPVIELQVAKAGYRLAAWLDLIADRVSSSAGATQAPGEL
ncbi:S1/P1 nuclease [Durotheca rogersii]|uniref:S1/P1 nuclease n=1 Tax=Durotheca rogersii TaxID=419775 RepID=UPI0022211207|nr:S1/P1 nuclease [Durotheca rogersii]KAI5867591.1 S1/P1 nuclease [Durotheca rogersii]